MATPRAAPGSHGVHQSATHSLESSEACFPLRGWGDWCVPASISTGWNLVAG